MLNHNWLDSVHHDSSPAYVVAQDTNFKIGSEVTLRLRASLDAPVEQILVRTTPNGEQEMTPMQATKSDKLSRWWELKLKLEVKSTNYRFYILTDEGGWWLTAYGMIRHTPTDATDFKLLANYDAPNWVRDAIFYQIFPERFAQGNPANQVKSGEYLYEGKSVIARKWDELPNRKTGAIEFFGGDLPGIVQKLDYLQELGVTALYLTPIFTAPSSHKYDVGNYREVDRHFGGDEALAELRKALDARGMKLVLDIVPNHCGATNQWFTDAQKDPNAPTAEFFTFRKRPDDYDAWLGVKSLPKLNYRSLKLRVEMYEGENSVMRYWMREPFRIDGWRMDVANMLGRQGETQLQHKVGRGIRRAVKGEKPDLYLLGENFFDGTPHLQGDELDAKMNYRGFSLPLLHWLAGKELSTMWGNKWADHHPLPTESMVEQWRTFLAAIPWQIATQQFNALSTHDVPRMFSALGEDKARVQVAATLLFTYPGVPSVYYGEEIGLPGGPDPDNRRPMPWDEAKWDKDLRAFYRQLIELRKTSPALRGGGLQFVYAAGNTVAFLREAPEEKLLIVARRENDNLQDMPVAHANLADGTQLTDVLSGATVQTSGGFLPLAGLPPVGVQVLRVSSL